MSYRVMLVEHDRLMLEQLSATIQKAEGFDLVAKYQAANDAIGQGSIFKPNLILLDADDTNAATMIQDFHHVYPAASIIGMGEKWNAESASHYVRAGAKGYMVKPFTEQELKEAVETFGKAGMEVGSEAFTFFSPKGKSGKTTLIANLAMALARETGEKVGIIDADLQFGDMAVFFNLTPSQTIVEAVRDASFLSPVTLNPYFTAVTDQVHVLCGTRTPNLIDKVTIDGFERIISMSKSLFRYVLIDVPQAFNPTSIAAAEGSDVTFVVAMLNGGYELQHMRRAIDIFRDWEDYQERVKPIFTRVTPCDAASQQMLSIRLDYPVAAVIPNAYDVVSAAADNGRMALDISPDSPISRAVTQLAQIIINGRDVAAKNNLNWEAGA